MPTKWTTPVLDTVIHTIEMLQFFILKFGCILEYCLKQKGRAPYFKIFQCKDNFFTVDKLEKAIKIKTL